MADILNFSHNSKTEDGSPKWSDVDEDELPDIAFADESDRSFPHHWISGGKEKDDDGRFKDGTMYLHEGGLDSSWTAANNARSKKEASKEVKDHLEKHRKALGKDDKEDSAFIGYRVRNQATEKTMDIYIYDVIGYEDWNGDGITAKKIAHDLQSAGKLDKITAHINSPGGRVFEAVAIYNLLKSNAAHVHVSIEGLAASSASIIAMCGNTIEMANNAMMMIHKPWTFAMGNADQLRKDAEMLDELEAGSVLQTYLNQCQKTGMKDMAEQLSELMSGDGTWMSADKCLGYGLIDSITDPIPVVAAFDLSRFGYKNVPQDYLNRASTMPSGFSSQEARSYAKEIGLAVKAQIDDVLQRHVPENGNTVVNLNFNIALKMPGTDKAMDRTVSLATAGANAAAPDLKAQIAAMKSKTSPL